MNLSAHDEIIRRMASEGETGTKIAAFLGVKNFNAVYSYMTANGIQPDKLSRDQQKVSKYLDLKKRYEDGETFEQIGQSVGLTRERVRQILFWGFGVTRWDGGVHARSVVNKFRKKSKLDALRMERSGCSQSEYIEIRDMRKGPTGPYTRQRHNAIARGIEWKFSLWSWWQFWQESGKWSKRGRGGNRYVMCRFGDVGPYSPDNCYIATSTKNLLHYREKRDGKLTLFSTPKDLERIDDEIGI